VVWKEPGKDKDTWEEGGQGSPDLEKLVDDLQRRFSSLFRRRQRGRGRSPAALWLVPLAFCAWLLSGCYVVSAGDRGVAFLLGRLQSVAAPGLHWHVPWPLGGSEIVSGVDQGLDYVRGYGALLTADGNAVSAEVVVHYGITDVPQYLFANASPAGVGAAADALGKLADSAVSASVAHATLAQLMGPGVDTVETAARDALLASLQHYPLGVEVSRVTLTKVSAPAPLTAAYTAVRQAELSARQQSDAADAYAADVLPKARGEADSRVEAAKSYASRRVQSAQADAAAFGELLAAYKRAPEVTRESLYLSTLQQILAQVDRVVVVLSTDKHVTLSLESKSPASKSPPAAAPVPKSVSPAPPKAGSGGAQS
jgi:modulator of FtsH protease HflK